MRMNAMLSIVSMNSSIRKRIDSKINAFQLWYLVENLAAFPNPMAAVPGFDALRKQQEAFLKTMMGGMPGWSGSGPAKEEDASTSSDDIADIKKQLAELQKKLSKL